MNIAQQILQLFEQLSMLDMLTEVFRQLFKLDVIAGVIGVLGAVLVARYDRLSWLGWACWIVSNTLWIYYGLNGQIIGILIQNSVYLVTAVSGLKKCRAAQLDDKQKIIMLSGKSSAVAG
jgi:hypothetical protein